MTTQRTLRLLCLLLCSALLAPAVMAQPVHADEYAAIGADIEQKIAAGELTGVSVALVKDGKIVWEKGYGWANREAGQRANEHTAFSIASTTKPFTTTAVMLLAAQGKLDLDRPANDYLGAEKIVDRNGDSREATVRRLATHSSGLPTFFAMYPQGGTTQQPPMSVLIRDYGHLVAPAGERYEYSNLGMGILGEIVARQSGRELGQFLHDAILQPLDMRDSFFDTDTSRRHEMATRYADDGTALPFYLTATPASGELYASAHDLARFALLHLGGKGLPESARILSDARLDELHRPATQVAPHFHYAMGWEVYDGRDAPRLLHHRGGQSGVITEFVLLPDQGVAAIVLSNRRGPPGFIAQVRDRLLKTVVADWNTVPSPPAPALQALNPAKDFQGSWRGTLLAQGKLVPVLLSLRADGTGTLSVDGQTAQPITDLGLMDGQISGDTHGRVPSADVQREGLDALALGLKLRGGRIDGEIVAWRKTSTHMVMLPFWTDLQRVAAP